MGLILNVSNLLQLLFGMFSPLLSLLLSFHIHCLLQI